ncbi:carbohydrate kinase family protein [Mycobacterium sp. 21AC1]|uniref:carbohydrate kinase family protein n=1 Tax=[Mycobacterium] appelbergii TaxID=2939269 RepID=UPI0029390A89|nr:carbohydrate kinase family protein [Mycobacterium sp. 21AC1]MDV3125767.1 carbohydrate kinase family protein [Mycobacterium sp. 21AC1]
MTALRALFVGDASWDTCIVAERLPDGDEKVVVNHLVDGPGGVAANSAMAFVRTGAPAEICTATGDDLAATEIVTGLEETGLTVTAERLRGKSSRAVTVLTDGSGGEKRLFLAPGAAMYPSPAAVRAIQLENVGWVHTALYDLTAGLELADRCRQAGIRLSIDLEPATIPADVSELAPVLQGCAAVMVNRRARSKLPPDGLHWLIGLVEGEVIETLDADGVRINTSDGSHIINAPKLAQDPVDTTGAGDAFAGWYIAERMVGHSPLEAAEIAVTAATYSVQRLGTYPSYPDRNELATFRGNRINRKATP